MSENITKPLSVSNYKEATDEFIKFIKDNNSASKKTEEMVKKQIEIIKEKSITSSPILCSKCDNKCCTIKYDPMSEIPGYYTETDITRIKIKLLRYIPLRKDTYRGMCLFYSKNGCIIPRKYRSETCLTYKCSNLEFFVGLKAISLRKKAKLLAYIFSSFIPSSLIICAGCARDVSCIRNQNLDEIFQIMNEIKYSSKWSETNSKELGEYLYRINI